MDVWIQTPWQFVSEGTADQATKQSSLPVIWFIIGIASQSVSPPPKVGINEPEAELIASIDVRVQRWTVPH